MNFTLQYDDNQSTATFSECRRYRFTLTRTWGEVKPAERVILNFLMLNPSTADEVSNDPTVERCERRARMWGYDGLIVTNIFAWRATDPKQLRLVEKPIGAAPFGEDNNQAIVDAAGRSKLTICGWGQNGVYLRRGEIVRRLLAGCGHRLHYLKLAKDGQPYHPLYLPYDLTPLEWK